MAEVDGSRTGYNCTPTQHRFISNFNGHRLDTELICLNCGETSECSRCNSAPPARARKCTVCGLVLAKTPNLEKHMRIHIGSRPYKCFSCMKGFKQKHHLDRHLLLHGNQKPLVCLVCNSRFASADNLRRHMVSVHLQEQKHACHVCGARFSRGGDRTTHLRKEHGFKFRCYKCPAVLSTRDEYTEHCVWHLKLVCLAGAIALGLVVAKILTDDADVKFHDIELD